MLWEYLQEIMVFTTNSGKFLKTEEEFCKHVSRIQEKVSSTKGNIRTERIKSLWRMRDKEQIIIARKYAAKQNVMQEGTG